MKKFNVKVIGQDKTTYMTDTGPADIGIVRLRVNGHKMIFMARWTGTQVVMSLEHDGSAQATRFYEENLPEIKEAILEKLSNLEEGVTLGGNLYCSPERAVLN